jgi:hypothetical protein
MKINETPLTPISEKITPAESTATASSSDVKAAPIVQGNLNGAIDQAMASFDHVLAAVRGRGTSSGDGQINNQSQIGYIENDSWQFGSEAGAPGTAGQGQPGAPGKINLGDLAKGSGSTTPSPMDVSHIENFSFSFGQVLDPSNHTGGGGAGKVKFPDFPGKSPSMANQDPQIHKPRHK